MNETPTIRRAEQWPYVVCITLAGATLSLARYLQPSARGFGTHEQLGLPPCIFFKLTGIPCPSCGLTTSFAHAAHGHLLTAFITQPFGLLAFGLTVLSIPLALYLLHRRIAWARILYARQTNRAMLALLALYLLSWIYKIIVT